jgi:hypothetical protein
MTRPPHSRRQRFVDCWEDSAIPAVLERATGRFERLPSSKRAFFSQTRWRGNALDARFEDMASLHRHRSLRSRLARMPWVLLAVVTAATAPASAVPAASQPIVLTQGATYRARLKLGFFQCLASRDRIERKLEGGGFAGVRVFTSARDLPADWPARFRSRTGSCERYAEGVWARPTTPRRRPSSIESWWVASSVAPPSVARP